MIAQVLASRHAQRIDRLVLSSTFRPGAPMPSINPDFARFAEIRSRLPASIHEFAQYFFTPGYLASHPEALATFAGNKRTDEQKARRGGVIPRPISVDIGRITAPTLVLVGAEDRLIPPRIRCLWRGRSQTPGPRPFPVSAMSARGRIRPLSRPR